MLDSQDDWATLWATNIEFLNDSKELHAGLDELHSYCIAQQTQGEVDHLDRRLSNARIALYKTINAGVQKNLKNRDIYITSFSDKRDNLRQWMSYCPSNGGYCIVFDDAKLRIEKKEQEQEQEQLKGGLVKRWQKVQYGGSGVDNLLNYNVLKKQIENGEVQGTFVPDFVNDLMFMCCSIKPAEFDDESETRLIVQSSREKTHVTNFRTRSGILIPYVKHSVPKDSILEIIIGPNVNSDLAVRGLEDYLLKQNINCKISKSNCSLREF